MKTVIFVGIAAAAGSMAGNYLDENVSGKILGKEADPQHRKALRTGFTAASAVAGFGVLRALG